MCAVVFENPLCLSFNVHVINVNSIVNFCEQQCIIDDKVTLICSETFNSTDFQHNLVETNYFQNGKHSVNYK